MDMLIFGLSVTVVGMLIVFFGLIILIGLIKLVTVMTTLECSVSLRKLRLRQTSMMTRKPIPPKMISPAVTRLSKTSF